MREKNVDIKKLEKYGFNLIDENYVFEKKYNKELLIIIVIDTLANISADVIDLNFNDRFEPFYQVNSNSTFSSELKNEVEELIEDIKKTCFIKNNIQKILLDYCIEQFNPLIESPWKKYPSYKTLKANNKKWFALFFQCKKNKLSDLFKTEEKVEILNVKIETNEIEKIVDDLNYFRAYHMNKNNWITILLDDNLDIEKTKTLIEKSFLLITNSNN